MAKLITLISLVLVLLSCQINYKVPVSDRSTSAHTPPRTYTAKANDNLFLVSMKYNLDYQQLGSRNGIKYPYRLKKGQKIVLSDGNNNQSTSSSSNQVNATALYSKPKRTIKVRPNLPVRTSPKPTKVAAVVTLGAIKKDSKTKRKYGSTWQWPVKGKVIQTFAQSASDYKGIDIAGKKGQKVYAAASGIVVYAGDDGLAKYGNLIIINHDDISISAYAHNAKFLVDEGQEVKRGQAIATMGDSGADRVKLHFEIRKDGDSVNPQNVLP